MVDNYNVQKLELVNFFKKEKYTQFDLNDSKNKNNNVYFYKKNPTKFHIICISNSSMTKQEFLKDNKISEIRDKFPAEKDTLILFISLTDDKKTKEFLKDMTFLYLNENNYEDEVKKDFPKFKSNIKKPSEEKTLDLSNISTEELAEGLQDKDSDIFKSVKKTKNKIQAGNLKLVWPYIIMLTILPAIFYFIRPLIFGIGDDISNPLFFEWIFGGVNRDFLIGANQWWRLIVYPFIFGTTSIFAIIQLIIWGIMIFMCVRFLEVSTDKWKILLSTFVGYILLGLVLGIANPAEIFAGAEYVIYILYGMLILTIWKKHNVTSVLARNYTFWIPLTFVLQPLFTGDLFQYLYIALGFTVGGVLMAITDYNWKELEWSICIPILSLLAIIITPIILIAIQNYVPPVNFYVYHTYLAFDSSHLMSDDHIHSIFNDYYFKSDAWISDHNLP